MNEEADALTNEDFKGFCPEKRIEVDLGRLPWEILPDYMELGCEYYKEIKDTKARIKEQNKEAPGESLEVSTGRGRVRTLREREPWG